MPQVPTPTPLLKLLTLPFLAVVLALAALVGWLSYRSANAAVDDAAQQWLGTALQRVADELTRQQDHADKLLQAALPDGVGLPDDGSPASEAWAQRLWTAARLHPQERSRIDVVSPRGPMMSLQRVGKDEAVFEIQGTPDQPASRQILQLAGAGGAPNLAGSAAAPDLRRLAWAPLALSASRPGWAPISLDGPAGEPALVRFRPVKDAGNQLVGAIATPLSLQPVQDLLGALKLPPQGVAFVVERSGLLIASSAGPAVSRRADGSLQRLHVREAESELVRAAYDRSLPHLGGRSVDQPGRMTLDEAGLPALVSSFASIPGDGGQDWAVVVAAPRAVFTANLLNTLIRTVAAALAAVACVLLIAAWIKRRLAVDVLSLTRSLNAVAEGELDAPPAAMRNAELEPLHDAVRRTQLRLRHDRQLGLANREAVLNRLHDRMRPGRRHNDAPLLALLVVNLDRFRDVNQQHGFEAGDLVLQTMGKRLRQTVRDSDLVARWAGDQFVLLLDGVASVENANRVRDQVERVLRDPVELGPGQEAVELAGTVGLALSNAESSTPEAFMQNAEADMGRRKSPARG